MSRAAMTVVYAAERHRIVEQHCNGAQVITKCHTEIWVAPANRDNGQKVPNCVGCYGSA